MNTNKSFMPVPNPLIEALFCLPLTGSQWRVLLWALRHTLGWNRDSTPFTWYRVAKETGMNRSTALRAARPLFETGLLSSNHARLSIQTDPTQWRKALHRSTRVYAQRKRCAHATLFRGAIDMVKDSKKKERSKKEKRVGSGIAGAAQPIAGKYAHLAEA
jgi:phage replication O-like protein O